MIRRQYIDNTHGGQIHFAQAGRKSLTRPSILCLHQTPRSWDEFKDVILNLHTDYHVVAMDLPGMGASSSISDTPKIEDYAQAAKLVIEHLGRQPMVICGHHTGGVVAIELAAHAPHLTRSLILSSTPWLDADIRLERSKHMSIDKAVASRDGTHLIEYWQQRSGYYPENVDFMNRFIGDLLKTSDPTAGHTAVGQYHMEQIISKIDCPVLLVEHMKDPFAVKHTSHLKAAISHAQIAQIPNGHVSLEYTAKAFSKLVKDWIQ